MRDRHILQKLSVSIVNLDFRDARFARNLGGNFHCAQFGMALGIVVFSDSDMPVAALTFKDGDVIHGDGDLGACRLATLSLPSISGKFHFPFNEK